MVVAEEDRANHGGTTSMNGHASHCHCCASQTTSQWATIAAEASVRVPQQHWGITGVNSFEDDACKTAAERR